MYRKILVPVDGSDLSNEAALAGIQFARENQAETLAIFVAPLFHYPIYVDMLPPDYQSEDEYKESMVIAGQSYFVNLQKEAERGNVKFSGIVRFADAVAREIVKIAQDNHCDLIFMGSHGRGGWGQIILGSVTAKVLSLCDIPVFVHRLKKDPGAQAKRTDEGSAALLRP